MKRIVKTFLLFSIVLFCSSMLIYLKPAKILDFLSVNIQNICKILSPTGEPWFRIPDETTPTKGADSLKPAEVSPTKEPPAQTITLIPTQNNKKSILDLLQIATEPIGKTMYVWGGGWNEEDTAAGVEAVTIGISNAWEAFARLQDSSYDYNNTRYQIHDGLDCSGYIGWLVYNAVETENGKEGYVLSASKMAADFASRGFGEYLTTSDLNQHWQAGDIMSMNGHVWMVVGMCEDGSVLMLHSSPPGVGFYGTTLADGSKSQAVTLAEHVMKTYYPDWYAKYPKCDRPYFYLTTSSAMRWNRETLTDDEDLSNLSAQEIVHRLFE